MKRLTLVAAGLVVLAGSIIALRPLANHSQAATQHHPGKTDRDRSNEALTEARDARHHVQPPAEASDRFQEQARVITSMPQDTARENAVRELAQQWAKEAPLAAERWANALDEPAERERALTQVCLAVSELDPRDAIRIARLSELHPSIVDAIATRWAAADFESAFAWADSEPRGEARDRLLSRLIQSRAGDAPAEAATMLSKSILSGQAHEETTLAIVHQWFLKDPDAARQWVRTFPEGPVRERASREVQAMTTRREQAEATQLR